MQPTDQPTNPPTVARWRRARDGGRQGMALVGVREHVKFRKEGREASGSEGVSQRGCVATFPQKHWRRGREKHRRNKVESCGPCPRDYFGPWLLTLGRGVPGRHDTAGGQFGVVPARPPLPNTLKDALGRDGSLWSLLFLSLLLQTHRLVTAHSSQHRPFSTICAAARLRIRGGIVGSPPYEGLWEM